MKRVSEDQLALFSGRELRDQAIERVAINKESYVQAARKVMHEILDRAGRVTSDDVRDLLPVPDGMDPRVLGAVFARCGLRRIGWKETRYPQAHARPIAIWTRQ